MKGKEWMGNNLPLLLVGIITIVLLVLIQSFQLPKEQKHVKVGCLLIGSKEDGGWNEGHYSGLLEACHAHKCKLAVKEHVDEMDEDAWFMVRNTPKVTGFLGSSGGGTKPVAVPKDEMDAILEKLGMIQKPVFEIYVGDRVEVTEGSFKGTIGEVSAVNLEKEVLTILIELFGRMTPMEFPFNQVKKL